MKKDKLIRDLEYIEDCRKSLDELETKIRGQLDDIHLLESIEMLENIARKPTLRLVR